ncbi:hypothetical protein FRB90_004445, partial [Tulasnella sp. 427]
NGLDKDLPQVRRIAQDASASPNPIVALFCEFPSNPLLRSPNLVGVRKNADEFNFLFVVDETIGNFVNVDVLKYADVVVSSITKVFSEEANVMGDAVYMERSSRDFRRRIDVINRNAEAIADFLRIRGVRQLANL